MQIYSWGCNGNGQLGIGNTITGYYPQLVKTQTIFTSVCVYNYVILFKMYNCSLLMQMSAGSLHVLAVNDCGHLFTWGCNSHGQLGDGTIADKFLPVQHKAYRCIATVETY